MSLPDLLTRLDASGVRLDVRLVVDAPHGALTEETRGALSTHRVALLLRLVRELEWGELSTRRWGPAEAGSAPGIIIDRPDRGRMLAALEAAAREGDPYARAERLEIGAEAAGNAPGRPAELTRPTGPAD